MTAANQRAARREWWIDPASCDDEMDNVHDAFTTHPGQGPLVWQVSLVRVREVRPRDDERIAKACEKLREVAMAFQEGWAIDWGECLDFANALEDMLPEGQSRGENKHE